MRALLIFLALVVVALVGWPSREMDPDDPRRQTGERGVVMLSAEWCGYCDAMRRDLERGGVSYQEWDIEHDARGTLAFEALDARGVPVLVVGQEWQAGYSPQLVQSMLVAAGHSPRAP